MRIYIYDKGSISAQWERVDYKIHGAGTSEYPSGRK